MIGLVDSKACNLKAYVNLLRYLSVEHVLVRSESDLEAVTKLLLPGVGSFGGVMNGLADNQLVEPLKLEVERGKTLIGVCAGMQVLFEKSEETLGTDGLGLLSGVVKRLPESSKLQMNIGWHQLKVRCEGSLELPREDKVYFVHGYYCVPDRHDGVIAEAKFGAQKIPAVIREGNIIGIQFHPEKSGVGCLPFLRSLMTSCR